MVELVVGLVLGGVVSTDDGDRVLRAVLWARMSRRDRPATVEWETPHTRYYCLARHPGDVLVCTRPKKHAGLHVACGGEGAGLRVISRWAQGGDDERHQTTAHALDAG